MMKEYDWRDKVVKEAKLDLMDFLMGLRKKLTEGEFLQVVIEEAGWAISTTAKYMIRMERKGNRDIPGGLAHDVVMKGEG